jgi:transposase
MASCSENPHAVLVHTPIHASWLNKVEICLSIVKRKALTPRDFANLTAVAQRVFDFERHYEISAQPFEWRFTRDDLTALMRRLARHTTLASAA